MARLATRHVIVEGIMAADCLVHNLNDLPQGITAVAAGCTLEQVANRCADLGPCIISVAKMPIELI
jgi:hypothetical protein